MVFFRRIAGLVRDMWRCRERCPSSSDLSCRLNRSRPFRLAFGHSAGDLQRHLVHLCGRVSFISPVPPSIPASRRLMVPGGFCMVKARESVWPESFLCLFCGPPWVCGCSVLVRGWVVEVKLIIPPLLEFRIFCLPLPGFLLTL